MALIIYVHNLEIKKLKSLEKYAQKSQTFKKKKTDNHGQKMYVTEIR